MQETEAIAHGIPVFMQNSIILQTFGVQGFHPCQAAENIQIPPYISPSKALSYNKDPPESQRRNIFAYFRGKMEINPKNVSGLIYSRCASVPILCQAIASFASCGLYLSRPQNHLIHTLEFFKPPISCLVVKPSSNGRNERGEQILFLSANFRELLAGA
jgi:hypothetical protein